MSDLPSLKDQFFHLTDDAKRFLTIVAAGGKILTDQAVVDQRITTCGACEKFAKGRCAMCGCYMQVKVHLDVFKCPLGKW